MSEQPATPESTATAASALGALLRQAREQKGLSIGEVAERLKFSARRVEALENGDYQGLPEPVFIKGLLRTYIRFLELDEQAVAEKLQQIFPSATLHESKAVPPADLSFRDTPVKKNVPAWIIGVVILVVIGIAVYAWQSKSSAENARQTAAASQETGAQAASLPAVEASNVKVVPMSSSDVAASAGQTAQNNRSASDAAPAAANGTQTLVVSLKNRSWLQVSDAQGKVLISDVVPGNTEKRFDGTAPYKVIIGYALGARVQFAGKDVPVPNSSKKTASLTVGGDH